MAIDESFKKPGTVPFKWEIQPGVPKPLNHHQPSSGSSNHIATSSSLKPPPSSPTSFHFPSPRTQSNRFRIDKPVLKQPDVVSVGCFQTWKGDNHQRKTNKLHVDPVVCVSDLERLSRWSMSRSGSPFHDSPLSSSSFSSYRSSPRRVSVNDAEWAGYGLF